MGAMEEVAQELAARGVTDLVRMRQGVVQSGPASNVYTIRLGGSTVDIAGVRCLAPTKGSPGPRVGDTVWVAQTGSDLIIVGVMADLDNNQQRFELYGGQPYIDFHYNNNAADYNMRLINDASGRLAVYGGQFYVGGDIALTGGVDAAGNVDAWFARMGNGGHGQDYAHFGHTSTVPNSGGYAVLQHYTGETFINTVATMLHFRWANIDMFQARRVGTATELTFPSALPALGGNTMTYTAGGSNQVGYAASTREYKENIQGLGDLGLDNPIFSLEPRLWDYRKDVRERSDVKAQKLRSVGFVAEEVEEVIPEATWGELRKPTGLNTEALLAFAVDALKTLKAENEDLKRRVAALEANQ